MSYPMISYLEKNKTMKQIVLFLFLLLSFGFKAQSAKEILDFKPTPGRLVFDYGGFLSESEAKSLSTSLTKYFDSTSTQIIVLTLKDLDGYDPNQFTVELGSRWGVGEDKEDNGVVLMLSMNDRKSYIATGRGAEGPLPDVLCKRILDEVMKPLLKEGKYYDAIKLGTESIQSALNGEGFKNTRSKGSGYKTMIFLAIAVIILLIFIKRGGGNGRYISGRGASNWSPGGGFWIGGFGGGSSSSGGSSGGGWGDFGGFGGGDFGGGGAGGDW